MLTVISIHGVVIRLPEERWMHIQTEHPELRSSIGLVLLAVEKPDAIYEGTLGEMLAIKEIEPKKNIVVVYKEAENDGFIITAFFTRRTAFLEKRKKIWAQQT